ncbi:glycosyltransferase family 4 protein [Streptomyces sp. MS06]|uniref:glycosyltransferase family 4 protein n=1 Tax=Streptomyces sp. MS06 TaxID=3385974 RepID=UPI0039A3922E
MSVAVSAGTPWPHDRTVPAPHGAAEDPLVAARKAFFTRSPAGIPGAPEPPDTASDDLALLLRAEYGPRPRCTPPAPATAPASGLGREDAVVASLRHACRLAVPLTPEALLAHADGGPRLAAALTEMWPGAVAAHGPEWAREALRGALAGAMLRTPCTVLLLDLATSSGLRPLDPQEAARLAERADRTTRHAVWRYLHDHPFGDPHLPPPAAAADPYEALLLGPRAPLSVDPGRPGLLVAQSMLLGCLDTPGQGQSGGLSVLLGSLGEALAGTDGVAGVITVVAAGHEDLAADPRLLRERRPGHWVLRLPVDAAVPPPQQRMAAHRPALAWWAARLLGGLGRPVDVVHVRYADEGSLALAEAADRLGTRLVFTAAPDPHRRLAETYGAAAPGDADRGERLRDDLHRVFLADRLVDRADTVIGIPGPEGPRELVRHFPTLGPRYGPAGPPAPSEGIAPYTPAHDEDRARRALLAELFAGGDRPETLAPADRDLTLLLSVGRLHPVKQQEQLVHAWLASDLWRTTTLVLVGGAVARPSADEQRIRARLRGLVAQRGSAARRLAVVPAMPNDRVRRLEHALADPAHRIRSWYLCPSAKEEFGIAVLEAMEAGLPAAGPRRGGVAHYLRDGVNGLLLDTSTPAALTRSLRRLAALPEPERARLARAGHDTVTGRFSVTDMARSLADVYAETADGALTAACL